MPTAAEALYQMASMLPVELLSDFVLWQDIRVDNWTGGIKSKPASRRAVWNISTGTRVFLKIRSDPFTCGFEAEHVAHKTGSHFIDEMRRGPFAYWRHTHSFIPSGESSSILDDSVEFSPLDPFSHCAWHGHQRKSVGCVRHWRTRRDVEAASAVARWSKTVHFDRWRWNVCLHLGAFLKNGGHSVHHVATHAMNCRAHTVLDTLEVQDILQERHLTRLFLSST